MPGTRVKAYRVDTPAQAQAQAADQADAAAHGWYIVNRAFAPDGSLHVTYQHGPAPGLSEWSDPRVTPAAGLPAASGLSLPAVGVLAGGLMVAAGAFLPWASANAGIVALSVTGMDTSDGWLVAVIGAVLVLIGLVALRDGGNTGGMIGAILFGGGAFLIAGLKYSSVKDMAGGDDPLGAMIQVGTGLYVILAGGALAAFAGFGLRAPQAPGVPATMGPDFRPQGSPRREEQRRR